MTELLILGRIIWLWRASLSEAKKNFHLTSYRFLIAADTWVFLTLLLAICMSVPAINIYTHGTHITVAHTMGATIGINSFLLMAMIFHILHKGNHQPLSKTFNTGYLTLNISLLVFWIALIGAGVQKAIWAMSEVQVAFGTMMKQSMPWFILFFAGGVGITSGFALVMIELLKKKRAIRKPASTQISPAKLKVDLKNPVGIDSI
jgi:nitric oxide reductase subunit B